MAIALEQKNLLTYLQTFQDRLRNKTNINLFEKDSKTQAIIDVFAEQLLNDRREVINAQASQQISQATDEALEKIGSSIGLPILLETYAKVSKHELSLAFYVEQGTFGDLNNGSDFTIPKGTLVKSTALQNDLGKVISYSLTEDCICYAEDTITYASAKAEASGSDFNVGSSVLRTHNFTGYASKTGLLVLNFYPILNGRKRESNDQYRYRISQFYSTTATNNEMKAKLLALSVPGVVDTKIIPGHFGIGTVALVVLGTEYQTNDKLLNAVQQTVNNFALPGVKTIVTAAVNCLVDIEVTVKATRALSSTDQLRIKNTLKRITVNYLRSKGLGGTFSLSELGKIWSRSTNGVLQFSNVSTDIFDHIYVRRGYVNASTTERDTVAGVYYTLESDEFADLGTLTINFE